jgi:hypothetical protein
MNLNEILDAVVKKQAECDELEMRMKKLDDQRKQLEDLAAEALAASGLDRVTYAGRSWRVEVASYLSVPKDNRDAVLQAAYNEGIADELTTVNTATLKSWLIERKKEQGQDVSGKLAEGTAFDGLVSEYSQIRLRSRSV